MTDEVVPLNDDVEAAVRLGRAAVASRPWVGSRAAQLADQYEAGVRAGEREGALFRTPQGPVGIAVWESGRPLGPVVNLLYLEGAAATVEMYTRFWHGIVRLVGPVPFAPGEIAGLDGAAEARLMAGLGLVRFGRSEMRRDDRPLPALSLPSGARVRPVGASDSGGLARLHGIAYRGRFDRYLFLEEEDEERDAARMLTDLFGGRWGEFSPEGSWGLEVGEALVGAVLSVRRPEGVLIADVMVDPAAQGRGLGTAVMVASLRGLAAAGLSPVYLNVTEGNDRAVRLYERLGFVRSQGPSRDWYDPRRIPVRP